MDEHGERATAPPESSPTPSSPPRRHTIEPSPSPTPPRRPAPRSPSPPRRRPSAITMPPPPIPSNHASTHLQDVANQLAARLAAEQQAQNCSPTQELEDTQQSQPSCRPGLRERSMTVSQRAGTNLPGETSKGKASKAPKATPKSGRKTRAK
ncbi:hypothetical protein CVT24_012271 [Panaeolus cyanescens]|uniref:Uncharacterized protein n=1 Tax=Panaeolus cyanescens TaxID=181874 RepID=A0A409WE61_9AGAR|nr:hypothetical protein CVT24_012271 [Panaeolus cyanescens]